MRIAHVSDLHIRNFKYRAEYKAAFEDLYQQLRFAGVDLIINTGDTAHSKLAVSPELFDDVAIHCIKMCEIAPYWIILGNHDLNLKNKGRSDAISPIVRALQGRTQHELRMPEAHAERMLKGKFGEFAFWNHDIRGHEDFVVDPNDINVGLYHGSISGCVTDIGFVMEEAESEISRFDNMDYVLLGDIHKRQSFRGKRMVYPGSLIQQNYGEELEKGYVIWEIDDKKAFSHTFYPVTAPGRFYTIQVPSTLDLAGVDVPKGSRIRAIVDGELSPSRRMELESKLREAFDPIEVITPDSSGERVQMEAPDIDELVGSREKLTRDHLKERGLDENQVDEAMTLYRKYELGLDSDGAARGTIWQLQKISWDNMLNYGEGNVIDMTKLSGLVGIFAPNASGKSSIFDILLQSLFDKISKEVPRNIDLVNDNKDAGSMSVEFESSGHPYAIERSIERIHYGQRKFTETKQWGKTTLDFSSVDESMNGTSRPETEKAIRQIIGSFEDFALTTMVTQNPIFGLPGGADLLNCRETDRRKILFRFLDLDVYERIAAAVKDDLKELMGKLKVDREKLETKVAELHVKCRSLEMDLEFADGMATPLDIQLSKIRALIAGQQDVEVVMSKARDLDRRIRELDNSPAASPMRLHESKLKQSKLQDELASWKLMKPDAPDISLDVLVPQLELVRTRLEGEWADLSRNKITESRGRESLKTLEGIPCDGAFPTCKFIVDATSYVSQREVVEQAIAQLTTQSEQTAVERTSLEDMRVVHTRISAWEKKIAELDLRISKQQTELVTIESSQELVKRERDRLQGQLNELGEYDSLLVEKLRKSEEDLVAEIAGHRSSIDVNLRKLGAASALEEQAKNELAEYDGLKDRARIHEQVAEMCGKNGLPYRILTMVLPVINAEIAKILSGIVKFSVFFEDDPEEQTVSLFIRYGDYKSRPLSLGSGAEKFIASLAIRVALLSVSSLPKTDILIIDEGFGKLDPEHLEALQRMFEYLKEAFGTVFVVSHVDFMRDIVDHSIEITSLDGYAHVEVV